MPLTNYAVHTIAHLHRLEATTTSSSTIKIGSWNADLELLTALIRIFASELILIFAQVTSERRSIYANRYPMTVECQARGSSTRDMGRGKWGMFPFIAENEKLHHRKSCRRVWAENECLNGRRNILRGLIETFAGIATTADNGRPLIHKSGQSVRSHA